MRVTIDITSEQLVKAALKRYRVDHSDADVLLARLIADTYPGTESATVVRQAVTNSIIEGIQKAEREAATAENEFYEYGQTDLFGSLIPKHKVPKGLLVKSAAEMDEWMQNRSEVEREDAEEMRRHAEAQERKAERFAHWAMCVHTVCRVLTEAGIDPREISYGEALSKTEAVDFGPHSVSGTQAERPMRKMRPADPS